MNTIICPQCGKNVEISQAIVHQYREQARTENESRHKAEIEKIKIESEARATKRAKEDLEYQLKNIQNEAKEASEKNTKLQEQMLELTKELRTQQQKVKDNEFELENKLLRERKIIEIELTNTLGENMRLKEKEWKTQLDNTKKALEEAQRKAEQGSQQLQGEVLELDLEQQLHLEFPTDEILPVPKGIDGADIVQKVNNKFGQNAGSIIWEAKRTKAWSNSWLAKLREDKRVMSAHTAVLVSDVLPEGIQTFGFFEQIWVTSHRYAIPLTHVLRHSLLQVAQARSSVANKDEKLETLYQYLTDSGFKHRFESQVETIVELKKDLDAEQRATTRMWKKKEMQISRMVNNIAGLYGELQGILGSALPTIQGLDYNQLVEGKKDENPGALF